MFFFSEMVEAMVEKTPEYYNKYRKHFRYVIASTKPATESLTSQNYAFGLHAEEQDAYCPISEPHYHFLTEVNMKETSKTYGYPISCLYSTYFYLLFRSDRLEKKGEIIQKLDRAIFYNQTLGENSFFKQPKKNKEKIPKINANREIAVQTEHMSMPLMNRISKILDGPQAGVFYEVLNILTDGHGGNNTDSVSFTLSAVEFECKKTFEIKN